MKYEYIKLEDGSIFQYTSLHFNERLIIDFIEDVDIEELRRKSFKTIEIYNRGDSKLNTIVGYETIYMVDGHTVEFSNDGSIYVEPREHEYVKIGNDNREYDIMSINAEENLLTIIFVDDICDVPGTVIRYSINYQELEKYEGYTTLYRINGTTVQFSNDGSEYDPEAEAAKELAEVKSAKISELSDICSKAISDGVDVELNGEVVHFTYTTEDQQNIKSAFDLAKMTNFAIPYHADAMSCRTFAPDEISKVYVAEQVNLIHHTTYFNQLKQSIFAMDNVEDVENVTYGQLLTGEYLETYNAMMAQTQKIIDAMTSGE